VLWDVFSVLIPLVGQHDGPWQVSVIHCPPVCFLIIIIIIIIHIFLYRHEVVTSEAVKGDSSTSLRTWHEQIPSRISTESVVHHFYCNVIGEDLESASPHTTWMRGIDSDVQSVNITFHSAWRKDHDRTHWQCNIDTAAFQYGHAAQKKEKKKKKNCFMEYLP